MSWKKILPHLLAVVIVLVVSVIYFSPVVFDNKTLPQSDMLSFPGMVKSLDDYHKVSGHKSEWTPNMFSGMPSYQIDYPKKGNIAESCLKILTLGDNTNTFGVFFLLVIGFYVFMVCLGFNPWISLLAGLAYGLGSYNIIIIDVGHITKAWAMSMMAPCLGGMILIFKQKYVKGFIIFTLSVLLQLTANHIQITYYTLILAFVLGISYLIFAFKDKKLPLFGKSVVVLLVCAILSLLPIMGHLLVNNEYVKHTMRGGSELTQHIDTNKQDINKKGLDISYAFNWSYGKSETMTLLIPDYKAGGSSDSRVAKQDSKITKNRVNAFQNNRPKIEQGPQFNQIANRYIGSSYYGTQPFTAGPVYFGSIVIFLSLLGFLVLNNKWKWWLLAGTIISIILSWGSNFMTFNEFLFNHLPLYNKFRTPSMALVMANVTLCIMAFVGLNKFVDKNDTNNENLFKLSYDKVLYIAYAIVGGICLILAICPTLFSDFSNPNDKLFLDTLGQPFVDALIADRQSMFVGDSIRSFVFITLAFIVLLLYTKNKLKKSIIVVIAVGVLAIIDLWGVDLRYINKESFQSKAQTMITSTKSQNDILDRVEKEKINHYRVYSIYSNPFNDSQTSYFLPSIGGYSAAKLQRYQDIIDFYLSNTKYKQNDLSDTTLVRNNLLRQLLYNYKDQEGFPMPNIGVLSMLDTKYIIISDEMYVQNAEACGPAWFVDTIVWADNPDGEIRALDNFDPKQKVVINKSFKQIANQIDNRDKEAKIELIPSSDIMHLTYKTDSKTDQIAVFSEIYYSPSWKCFIDNKPVPYFCANYILRGVKIPKGNHTIEFICASDTLKIGNTVAYIGSILLVLSIIGIIAYPYIKKKKSLKDNK